MRQSIAQLGRFWGRFWGRFSGRFSVSCYLSLPSLKGSGFSTIQRPVFKGKTALVVSEPRTDATDGSFLTSVKAAFAAEFSCSAPRR
jgi:hypothetical protein